MPAVAIELPGEVAQLLNFIGIPSININEDRVREFAGHVRDFGSNISDAHQDATSTLTHRRRRTQTTDIKGRVAGAGPGDRGRGGGTVGSSFDVDMGELETHGEVMRSHAQTVSGHVSTFTSNVQSLDFTS